MHACAKCILACVPPPPQAHELQLALSSRPTGCSIWTCCHTRRSGAHGKRHGWHRGEESGIPLSLAAMHRQKHILMHPYRRRVNVCGMWHKGLPASWQLQHLACVWSRSKTQEPTHACTGRMGQLPWALAHLPICAAVCQSYLTVRHAMQLVRTPSAARAPTDP